MSPGEREIAVYFAEALDRAGEYAGARAVLDGIFPRRRTRRKPGSCSRGFCSTGRTMRKP